MLSRPESLPDRKSSLEKGEGGLSDGVSRRKSCRGTFDFQGNRLFSALIPNLGCRFKITASFVGLIAFFAEPYKPRLGFESPVSAIIGANKRVF